MSCLLVWAATCLLDPSNVYVRGEILPNPGYRMENNEGYWCRNHECRGPLAELRVGVHVELPKGWRLDYGLLHRSFPFEKYDKGLNVPFVSLEWRPWR